MENTGIQWLNDPNNSCADLVQRLKAGGTVESRDFLRPIFKWLKHSSRHFDASKAFSFLEWMTSLRELGDSSLGLPPMPHLQPKYGYNTIVTMSQRNDSKLTAMRAYECMLARNDEIDVFTYTSLLDVIGRNGHFDDALAMYEKMRAGKNQPNVVTYITLIRVLSGWHCNGQIAADESRAKETIVRLLKEADELAQGGTLGSVHSPASGSAPVFISGTDGKLEVSVYNAALAGFVKLVDFDYFTQVLQIILEKQIVLSGTSVDIICKFYHLHLASTGSFSDVNSYGDYLVSKCALSSETAEILEGNLNSYLARKQSTQSGNTVSPSYTAYTMRGSCLGRNATISMRESVISHDLDKLLERLSPSTVSTLHESDFITLLHQCRKRKWSDQIRRILQCMREVSTEGLPLKDIPPQPSLAPSLISYEAALAGYFCVDAVAEAWELFQEVLLLSEVWECVSFDSDIGAEEDTYSSNALHFFRFVMKGFLSCGDSSHAAQAFDHMELMHVSPSFALAKCLLRGYGCNPQLGVSLLEKLLSSTDSGFLQSYAMTSVEGFTKPKISEHVGDDDLVYKGNRELLLTLLESVAVLGRPEFVSTVLEMCASSSCDALRDLTRAVMCFNEEIEGSTTFIMTLLMAASSLNSAPEACQYISQWQYAGYLPRVVLLYSLTLEALAGSVGGTSQRAVCEQMPSLPFRGFLRVRDSFTTHCVSSLLIHTCVYWY
mmetsp:Transcript_28704/g.48430  ORF Transcript_28704/g.48430 Transcript_28704/m.48430 type:complete len:719 (-) Transcript_28704:2133-4289(-)